MKNMSKSHKPNHVKTGQNETFKSTWVLFIVQEHLCEGHTLKSEFIFYVRPLENENTAFFKKKKKKRIRYLKNTLKYFNPLFYKKYLLSTQTQEGCSKEKVFNPSLTH